MTIELSAAQRAVLAPACDREDRCIYPVTAQLKGGAAGNVAKSLLKRGLIEEVPAENKHTVWRCAEDGAPLTLRATDAGCSAIGGHEVSAEAADAPSQPSVTVPASAKPRGAAQEALVTLLQRPQGATSSEMQEATGWLPHSVRGALSGVVAKKLGHKVTSAKEDGRGRVYRIIG